MAGYRYWWFSSMKLNSRIFVEFPPSWQKKKEPSIALEFWELYIWDYITLPYI
jgi:hypothetical protein